MQEILGTIGKWAYLLLGGSASSAASNSTAVSVTAVHTSA